jgi:hypothetical protein
VANDFCFSIKLEDHTRAPHHEFHNLGLWHEDMTNAEGWKLATLGTIMKQLKHEKVNTYNFTETTRIEEKLTIIYLDLCVSLENPRDLDNLFTPLVTLIEDELWLI